MTSRRLSSDLQMTSERSKLLSVNFCFMGVNILVLWVKDFKNSISFGLWLLRGHLLAFIWPLRGQNWKVSLFSSGVSKCRFFGSRISKIALVLDYDIAKAIFWPPNDLWEVKISNCHFCFMIEIKRDISASEQL